MIVHMEGGRIHSFGSPTEVLADLEVSSAPDKEANDDTCERSSSDHSKEQSSAVRWCMLTKLPS